MEYLPSRKFVKTLIFFLLVGTVFFTGVSVKNKILGKNDGGAGKLLVKNGGSSFYTDSDKDSLYDFEEGLLGTDPFNKDTDGDGVSDGVQYQSKKIYPEIESPPDLFRQFLDFKGRTASFNEDGQVNITNALTQEASLRSLVIGQGKELDDKAFNQLVNSLANDFSQFLPKDKFSNKDIKTTKTRDIQSANKYILSVVVALEGENIMYKEDPLALLNNFINKNDARSAEALYNLTKAYERATKSLATVTVPDIFSKTHLVLLNSSYQITEALRSMRSADKDPVRSILAGAAYVHNKQKKQSAIAELVSYMRAYSE